MGLLWEGDRFLAGLLPAYSFSISSFDINIINISVYFPQGAHIFLIPKVHTYF